MSMALGKNWLKNQLELGIKVLVMLCGGFPGKIEFHDAFLYLLPLRFIFVKLYRAGDAVQHFLFRGVRKFYPVAILSILG